MHEIVIGTYVDLAGGGAGAFSQDVLATVLLLGLDVELNICLQSLQTYNVPSNGSRNCPQQQYSS